MITFLGYLGQPLYVLYAEFIPHLIPPFFWAVERQGKTPKYRIRRLMLILQGVFKRVRASEDGGKQVNGGGCSLPIKVLMGNSLFIRK